MAEIEWRRGTRVRRCRGLRFTRGSTLSAEHSFPPPDWSCVFTCKKKKKKLCLSRGYSSSSGGLRLPALLCALTQHGVEEFTQRAESCFWSSNMESQPQAGLQRTQQQTVLSLAPPCNIPLSPPLLPATHKHTSIVKIFCTLFTPFALRWQGEKSWAMKSAEMSKDWKLGWLLIIYTSAV